MLHGPLARTELGEWQVQGTDYAYTIHGWIKGVNAETLSPGRDIGKDGHSSGSHTSFARDAFGYALHYYEGDYAAISQPTVADHFLTDDAAFHSFNQGSYVQPKSLYNGNIMMMHTALMDQDNARVEEQRMKYEYDQLHRIHSWYSYRDTGLYADNTWELTTAQQTNDYSGSVSYTPNGDIRYLNRFGRYSEPYLVKDRFGYGYYNSGNNRFRLRYVNDLKASAGPLDMGPQPLDNYTYYDNGHLKSDSANFIRKIHWNVANKIDRIVFAPDSTKPEQIIFRYDAMGQRRVKLVQPDKSDSTTWAYTYYVRDAQGNVMTTYERGHMDISGTTRPAVYPYLNPTVDSDPPAWENIDTVAFFKASEFHLYGSDRLGVYNPHQWMAFLTNEDSLILPEYNYDLHAYDGDPCGCDTTSTGTSPPNDPCWCEDDDPCGCPACLNCIDCYCSGWPTTDFSFTSATHQVRAFIRGRKRYELKNHLGNVLEVISDRKLQITSDSLTVDGYNPDIWAWHDYNPFGTTQQARSWQATGYRYGFQGQEADDELFGADNGIDFGARMYDSRIGRWLTTDPLLTKQPQFSPYSAFENSPMSIVDPNGEKGIHYLTVTFEDGSTERMRLAIPDDFQVLHRVSGVSSDGHGIFKYFWYDYEQEHRITFLEGGDYVVESDPPALLGEVYRNTWELVGDWWVSLIGDETLTHIPGGLAIYTEDGVGGSNWTFSENAVPMVDATILMAYFKAAGKSASSRTIKNNYSPNGKISKNAGEFIKNLDGGTPDIKSLYEALKTAGSAAKKISGAFSEYQKYYDDSNEAELIKDTIIEVPGSVPLVGPKGAKHYFTDRFQMTITKNPDGTTDTTKTKIDD